MQNLIINSEHDFRLAPFSFNTIFLIGLLSDILPALIMVQGHQILSAATFAHTMVSPRRGLNRVCREGFRELPGEASFLTLVSEAYSSPEM